MISILLLLVSIVSGVVSIGQARLGKAAGLPLLLTIALAYWAGSLIPH